MEDDEEVEEIYTIEINLNEDFANACSYHIDTLHNTSAANLRLACEKSKSKDKWALIGLATSLEEACVKAERVRIELCKMHNRKPYGIEELLEGI